MDIHFIGSKKSILNFWGILSERLWRNKKIGKVHHLDGRYLFLFCHVRRVSIEYYKLQKRGFTKVIIHCIIIETIAFGIFA